MTRHPSNDPYAEVIGDPIAHSRSPIIHGCWLERLGIKGRYERTHVEPENLADFVARRRADANWFGCNVTIPHKVAIIPLLDALDSTAAAIGAVNCVERRVAHSSDRLIGHNTDVDGVRAALAGVRLKGRKAVLIGAGGGARAAVACLEEAGADIHVLARDPAKAGVLADVANHLTFAALDDVAAIAGAALIINASPLGMAGSPAMPRSILDALGTAPHATVMDMVYKPLETALLAAARAAGLRTVDGLEMLIGQARRPFRLFFGVEPPPADAALRALLIEVR